MSDDVFNPFSVGENEIVLPSDDQNLDDGLLTEEEIKARLNRNTELMSEGLERAIRGETVNSMMIMEDVSIAFPNYVIDTVNIDGPCNESSINGLESLIHPNGTVTLYVYTKKGLFNIGRGIESTLDRILLLAINALFSGRCRVYKNFEIGKPLVELKSKDISTMRLNI